MVIGTYFRCDGDVLESAASGAAMKHLVRTIVLGLVFLMPGLGKIRAESISATLPRSEYELFEPIVVHVILHLDKPIEAPSDPININRQLRRFDRRLRAELRRNSDSVSGASLHGGGFASRDMSATELGATVLGFFGTKTMDGTKTEFKFWDEVGTYRLVVRDIENNLTSDEIPIRLTAPTNRAAAELFQRGGVETLGVLLGELQHGNCLSNLEKLTIEHRDTVYAKYAEVVLARIAYRKWREGRSANERAATAKALVSQLRIASSPFPADHPHRSELLLALAQVEVSAGSFGEEDSTLRLLLTECQDSLVISQAKKHMASKEK